jgi:hypothetical protein
MIKSSASSADGTRPSWGLVAWLLFFGLFLLWGYSRNQNFPFWYTWDEGGKAAQVVSGNRDLHHPLLLINTTEACYRLLASPPDLQNAAFIGRLISAGFSIGAALCCSLLAWRLAGPSAGIFAGILVSSNINALWAAHHFKEDTALWFGWALTLLAIQSAQKKHGAYSWVMVGVAAALCASGKHIGWMAAAISLPVAWMLPASDHRTRWKRVFVALIAMMAAWCMINYQILTGLTVFRHEMAREIDFLFHDSVYTPFPGYNFIHGMGVVTGWGFALYLIQLIRRERKTSWIEGVILCWAAFYSLLLLFIARVVSRYYLPLWGMASILAGLALAQAWQGRTRPGWIRRLTGWTAPVVVIFQVYIALQWTLRLGREDYRIELARYLDQNHPQAFVAYDFMADIPDSGIPERNWHGWTPHTRLMQLPHWYGLKGYDPLSDLRQKGVTHVAINLDYVARYQQNGPLAHMANGQFADAPIRLPFYNTLRASGSPVWYRPKGVTMLAPELALYALPPANSDIPSRKTEK